MLSLQIIFWVHNAQGEVKALMVRLFTSTICLCAGWGYSRQRDISWIIFNGSFSPVGNIYNSDVYRQHWTPFRQWKYRLKKKKERKIEVYSSPCSWRCGCFYSVFKSPLLDAGIVGAGDEGMIIDPGQVTNMVQPVSVCRNQSMEEPRCKNVSTQGKAFHSFTVSNRLHTTDSSSTAARFWKLLEQHEIRSPHDLFMKIQAWLHCKQHSGCSVVFLQK